MKIKIDGRKWEQSMPNMLTAIERLADNPILKIGEFYLGRNRINNIGDGLEAYIQDLFADSIDDTNEIRRRKISNTFSYLGNARNPPDMILKNGDAIEVKKIEVAGKEIALNSSYPKAKLFANSPMITKACRNCENWTEKDMWYIIGTIDKNNTLKSLCVVFGADYAASSDTYERIKLSIKTGILEIPEVEFAETDELGRVNNIDPLGITYLRIRGMWGIQNPLRVFNEIYAPEPANFNFMAVINDEKYNLMGGITSDKLSIRNVEIKNPDNPAQLKNAKLITFSVRGEL